MENPYQSPVESSELLGPLPIGMRLRQPGLVRHVRVVATLMLIQGGLELIAGIVFGLIAFLVPLAMMHDQQEGPPQEFFWGMTAVYVVFAIAALTAATLHIMAGLQNRQFRGRTLGIIAATGGLATLFTCYCLPTAVAVGVYGLIVLLNEEVAEAFCMGEARHSAQDILAAFSNDPITALASPFAPSFSDSPSAVEGSSVRTEPEP